VSEDYIFVAHSHVIKVWEIAKFDKQVSAPKLSIPHGFVEIVKMSWNTEERVFVAYGITDQRSLQLKSWNLDSVSNTLLTLLTCSCFREIPKKKFKAHARYYRLVAMQQK
jgi:hypothetical protein